VLLFAGVHPAPVQDPKLDPPLAVAVSVTESPSSTSQESESQAAKGPSLLMLTVPALMSVE
jgi:hypothetical protein